MKKLKFPTAQTILFIIAGLVALSTWIVPSGKFDTLTYNKETDKLIKTSQGESTKLLANQKTLEGLNIIIPIESFTDGSIYKPISIPNTYQQLKSSPQGFFAFLQSPIKGIIAAADIIFLVLIIGGLIGIMNLSGAFDAGIASLAKKLKGREFILIILVTTLIAIGGTTFGLAEETMAFYPILIPVFLAAGYDTIVGLACIFLGSSIGTMCSTVNPFSTIIASDAAGITWTNGLDGRFAMLLICTLICIIYILRYAKKVKADPSKSIVFEQKEELEAFFGSKASDKTLKLTSRLRLILFVFTSCFIIMIVGVSFFEWWLIEMTTTFLVGAIIIGFLARVKETDFMEAFTKGAGELLGVAFIIGLARGVTVIMDDGLISDTMLYYASNATEGMNKGLFVNVMLYLYGGLSFFISSTSGMAVLSMPIMAPLADTVGIGREIIVNAYQFGMGLFHFINPTGLILASLAIVKIGYDKWIKFVMPLFLILLLVTMVAMTVSVYL
ncbi:MAG: putative ion transporter superfamily protein YfcC [Saprospiraceae bacterium]|jgi:uncharacterized ion transporter superfamily protein YfcC